MVAVSPEVITAGAKLLRARHKAAKMADAIDDAQNAIKPALETLTGVRKMQIGEAVALLGEAQTAWGKICMAHDSLRRLLAEAGMDEPTDSQLLAELGGDGPVILGGGGGGR